MVDQYKWLSKKNLRSVDQLRLWPDNPRLNPEESHVFISDFVDDLTSQEKDKTQFFKLLNSIVEDGFIPADPIVVWKNKENNKYYVAEGNRRVLALKLLREPKKAPRSIRARVRALSNRINKKSINKILVNIAPSFEDAEWYINQRNSTSSLQKPWSRVQQQRWLSDLYDKYEGDINKITSVTKMTKSELEGFIRILKIKDLVKLPEVREKLSENNYKHAISHKFPISILERFFSSKEVKEKWGLSFDGIDLKFRNKGSFLSAYVELIRNIVDKDSDLKIDTRTITSNFNEILEKLPDVNAEEDESEESSVQVDELNNLDSEGQVDDTTDIVVPQTPVIIKNDPNRNRLIIPIYFLNSSSYRLNGLFNELKFIPIKYNNSVAASIRIFLDLSVLNYLKSEDLIGELCSNNPDAQGIKNINLSKRLEFLKQKVGSKSKNIINKILNSNNELSLDVLNGYVHSDDTQYLSKKFLNGFWDLLFPFFEEILEINEN